MQTASVIQDFELSIKEYNSNKTIPHRHAYFELIYVLQGSGIHLINGNRFPYQKNDLFLLTPEDIHNFESSAHSTFCIIDFTKIFLYKIYGRNEQTNKLNDLFKQSEYIFHNYNRSKGNIPVAESDVSFIQVLIDRLIWENQHKANLGELVAQNIVFLLLNLIGRLIHHLPSERFTINNSSNVIHEITHYIHLHIYDKELIKMERLARHFNKSKDYISIYFKRHTGMALKDYITLYKLDLIKTRLIYSDLNIAEIAEELNFTDESHLNKLFKKSFGKTAKMFRKEHMFSLYSLGFIYWT